MTELELKAFLCIIKNGSLSKAAEQLFVTQPALSRRIKNLENELGYALFIRGKGKREIELTQEGEAFISVAHKYLELFKEAKQIKSKTHKKVFNLASIGSVSTYLLTNLFQRFINENNHIKLCFRYCHSIEAYQYVADKQVELALVSDDMYYKNIETVPLFKDPMVLVSKKEYATPIHPRMLDVSYEIRTPWTPEFNAWHDYWFKSTADYKVSIDQMSLLEYFLSLDQTWAIVPISMAKQIKDVHIYPIEEGPHDRIIYYIKRVDYHHEIIDLFLKELKEELKQIEEIELY